jgi:hypothetical protein
MVSLRDYGYGTNDNWSSRMISLIDAVHDCGILEVLDRLDDVGKYHKSIRQDVRDLLVLFPLSRKDLKELYMSGGIPDVVRRLEFTEDQHRSMATKIIERMERNSGKRLRKRRLDDASDGDGDGDGEVEDETSLNDDDQGMVTEDVPVSQTQQEEETIEEIQVMNILPDQELPSQDELVKEAEIIMANAKSKLHKLFDVFVQQFQSEEVKDVMAKRMDEYIQELIDYKSYYVVAAHEEITEKLKHTMHYEDKVWSKEAEKLNEIKNNFCKNTSEMREKEKEIYKKDMEDAFVLANDRQEIVMGLKQLDSVCYNEAVIAYRNKHNYYVSRRDEKHHELCQAMARFDSLNAQVSNVKEYKTLLRKQLNLQDIRSANVEIKKLLKKICIAYTNVVTLEREHQSYEILAASFPCSF